MGYAGGKSESKKEGSPGILSPRIHEAVRRGDYLMGPPLVSYLSDHHPLGWDFESSLNLELPEETHAWPLLFAVKWGHLLHLCTPEAPRLIT